MTRPTRQPRQSDASSKRLFSHRRVVADSIRLIGDDDWVDDLDLGRLQRLPTERISDDLRNRLADMTWWAPFKAGAGGRLARVGALFHVEFQTSPNPHMAERLLEYAAMLRCDLRRSGWMSAAGVREAWDVPLVVYAGRGKWNAPRRLQTGARWMPPKLAWLQPTIGYLLLDSQDYAGDDAADGNLARAMLALEAASAEQLAAALERLATLLAEAGDGKLRQSFEAWCEGVLRPRLGDQLPSLANMMETTMLAETLQEWEELKFHEGRQDGRREGRQEVLEEERALLCSQAGRRFGAATGTQLADVLAAVEDGAELARIGTLIIDCDTGADFLDRARPR